MTTPWKKLNADQQKVLLYGSGTKQVHVQYRNRYGRTRSYNTQYEGAVPYLQRRHSEAESDYMREQIEGYMREVPCPTCGGARLKPESLGVTVGGLNIHQLCDLSIAKSADYLAALEPPVARDRMIAERVVKEVNARMRFLLDVGLDYLTLNRSAGTLAGRRGPAHPPGQPDRIGAGGRALRARRAVDRAPPARQPQAHRHPHPPARPRQHGDRGRARRGHHPRRRPRGRHRPGRGRARRRDRGLGLVRRPRWRAERSITGQYLAGKRTIPVPAMRREPGDEWLVDPGRAGAQPAATSTSRSRSGASWRSPACPARASRPSSTTSSTGR